MSINHPTYTLGILELCFLQKIADGKIKIKKDKLTIKLSELKELLSEKDINSKHFSELVEDTRKKIIRKRKQHFKKYETNSTFDTLQELSQAEHKIYQESVKKDLKKHLLPYKQIHYLLLYLQAKLDIKLNLDYIPYKMIDGSPNDDYREREKFDKWVEYSIDDSALELSKKNPVQFLFMFDIEYLYNIAGYLADYDKENIRRSAGGYAYAVVTLKNITKEKINEFLNDYVKNNLCYKAKRIYFADDFIAFPEDNFERFVVEELFKNRLNRDSFLDCGEVITSYNEHIKRDSRKRDRAVRDSATSINEKFKTKFKYMHDLIDTKSEKNRVRINEKIINPAY